MSNIRDVHLKIKELSSNNPDGHRHIRVNQFVKELNSTIYELQSFLDALYSTAFIDYYKGCKDVIALTETGKNGEIPLHSGHGDSTQYRT
ncbi:hypothetical protein CJD36_000785 [Flavipsychrobacter stenotrophus]|uniref:Uncharacterized protein n=1 Tax=Flavipsychrobacter stenotrophus TaxID=2077091 RepID=A0A2S7T0H9_9BACT|nr:hypothetical protein [Flavipsychrobacter stenotrophus]PQJ12325.1 hypothetical protein CJD36_000785 [Flavipsychrobacter stenotrophus]